MKYNYQDSIGIDTETSTIKFPWFNGHFVSLVSVHEPNGTKTSYLFTHNENKNLISAFATEKAKLQAKIDQFVTNPRQECNRIWVQCTA